MELEKVFPIPLKAIRTTSFIIADFLSNSQVEKLYLSHQFINGNTVDLSILALALSYSRVKVINLYNNSIQATYT